MTSLYIKNYGNTRGTFLNGLRKMDTHINLKTLFTQPQMELTGWTYFHQGNLKVTFGAN